MAKTPRDPNSGAPRRPQRPTQSGQAGRGRNAGSPKNGGVGGTSRGGAPRGQGNSARGNRGFTPLSRAGDNDFARPARPTSRPSSRGNIGDNMAQAEAELAAKAARLRQRRQGGNSNAAGTSSVSGRPKRPGQGAGSTTGRGRPTGANRRGQGMGQTPAKSSSPASARTQPNPKNAPAQARPASGRGAGKSARPTSGAGRGNAASARPNHGGGANAQGRPRKTRPGAPKPSAQRDANRNLPRFIRWAVPAEPWYSLPWLVKLTWILAYLMTIAIILGGTGVAVYKLTKAPEVVPKADYRSRPTTEIPQRIYRCELPEMGLKLDGPANLNYGGPLNMRLVVQNRSVYPCNLDLSPKKAGLRITSGEDKYFDGLKCNPDGDRLVVLIGPGETYTKTLTWDGKRHGADCQPGDPAPAGTYKARLQLENIDADVSETFTIR
ncbi:hypothetical protein BK816_07625 [Boudabousia tangfeifanii]|uniref:Uncharacterized protein n=1 Tax=Boudabousia tangfeifanii TaxID=1912795 RepID=A0A1D9MLR2_9ACTO|nr:hypothetical protein [Boudabousia tangfeifanii]AOZ73178.1 hypothetical protein BK816_07625 [Boudabousia tangfeifanii]